MKPFIALSLGITLTFSAFAMETQLDQASLQYLRVTPDSNNPRCYTAEVEETAHELRKANLFCPNDVTFTKNYINALRASLKASELKESIRKGETPSAEVVKELLVNLETAHRLFYGHAIVFTAYGKLDEANAKLGVKYIDRIEADYTFFKSEANK